jgi:hypothetical protein
MTTETATALPAAQADHDRLVDRLDAPLFTEALEGGRVLIVWGTSTDWRIQVYRPAAGPDQGAVLVSRAIDATNTRATQLQAIALGRALARAEALGTAGRWYAPIAQRRYFLADTTPGLEITGQILAATVAIYPELPETAPEAVAFRRAYVAAVEAGMAVETATALARRVRDALGLGAYLGLGEQLGVD